MKLNKLNMKRSIAMIALVSLSLNLYAACQAVCDNCAICTVAGAPYRTEPHPGSPCDDHLYYDSTSYSDTCIECTSYTVEFPATGKTVCDTLFPRRNIGTATRCIYVNIPKIGCIFLNSTEQPISWSCNSGTLSGDNCTCPPLY
jgi:hypothetical protein